MVSVSMVFCVLFFAGCGNDEEKNTTKKYITEENYTAEKGFANAAVTEDKLNTFYSMMESAVIGDIQYQSGEMKQENIKGDPNDNGNPKDIEYTKKFFDFSRNGDLFFGGEINKSHYSNLESAVLRITEYKVNGKLEFRGAFKGSIEYKNAHVKTTSTYILDSDGNIDDATNITIINGEIVIDGGNGQPITLRENNEFIEWFVDII